MQRKLIAIVAGMVLLAALWFIGRRLWPTTPPINPARFAGLGQVLAEESVKAVAGHGQIVAVIREQHQLSGNPAHDEFESLQKALQQQGAVSLAATEILAADPNEMVFGNGCSRSQLQAILAKHATAGAIVFLVGLPEWNALQAWGWTPSPGSAKIIVAVDGSVPTKTGYGGYFASGVLSVLIGRRISPAPMPAKSPQTPREWFEQSYQVYTPQNYESLPD